MKERFRRFMSGRYGTDELSLFLIYVNFGLIILNLVIRSNLLYVVEFILLLICWLRVCSKDHQRRYQENQRYLAMKGRIQNSLRRKRYRVRQNRDYRIFVCPGCGQKVRVPRRKGKVMVTCPKCRTEFEKRT